MTQKITPEPYRCGTWLCKAWNHWLNPLGNYIEPSPYPEKRKIQAEESKLPDGLWWALRNPAANLMNHWLGIMPIGEEYETVSPEANGWAREEDGNWSWWKKGPISLPYYRHDGAWTFYLGWNSNGSFGSALRRNSKP